MADDNLHNVVPVKDHLLVILKERDDRYEQRFQATMHALSLSAAGMEVRLTAMNEFRAQLEAQQGTFARKDEMEIRFQAIAEKLDVMAAYQNVHAGRDQGLGLGWKVLIAIVGLASTVALLVNLLKP